MPMSGKPRRRVRDPSVAIPILTDGLTADDNQHAVADRIPRRLLRVLLLSVPGQPLDDAVALAGVGGPVGHGNAHKAFAAVGGPAADGECVGRDSRHSGPGSPGRDRRPRPASERAPDVFLRVPRGILDHESTRVRVQVPLGQANGTCSRSVGSHGGHLGTGLGAAARHSFTGPAQGHLPR